jgi:tetratricopeptide (TPR) repeat protein
MALEAGTRLGRYEVLGLLGAGGMGQVYRARDTRLERTVALKVLPVEFASEPIRRARFDREARAISALEHPHICTLYDVGEEGGRAYLVMEHLEGGTLAARLWKGPLPLAQVLEVGTQIADALATAHQHGIVHRDLKPGNVMLTKTGVKLLDFGLARLTGQGEHPVVEELTSASTEADLLTGQGNILGTVPYMAPEQLEGRPADARTDIWALGVVLYEMLTGRRPFEGGSAATLIVAILQQEPPSLASLEPLAPPALEHVVGRCLAKDPDARWQTARDVASELGWISRGRTAAPAPAPSTVTPARRRRRAWAHRAVPALLLAAAAVTGVWWWHGRGLKPTLDPKQIAVAVFENRTGDPSLELLGRTTADHISEGLARIQGVQVVPAEARAGLAVSGTYSLDGDDLRIQPRLTDAATGRLQALLPAAGPRAEPTAAVETARQRVMGAVAVRLDPFWLGRDPDPPTYEAYQEFLTAWDLGTQPLPHLLRAVELDPGFVSAQLSLIAWLMGSRDFAEASRRLEVLEGRRATLSPVQRLHVDAIRASLAGHTGDAYVAARGVRELLPGDALTAFDFAWYAANANRLREAVGALTAPLDWTQFHARAGHLSGAYFWNLTTMLHQMGEHERELVEIRRGQGLHRDILWLHGQEAYALAALGRLDELERVVSGRARLASAGQQGHLFLFVGLELRAHGHREASMKMLARSLEALQGCPPEDAKTQGTRGMRALLLRLEGHGDEAQAIYDQLARETPADRAWQLAADRGVCAALRGDRAQALRVSDELSRLDRPFLLGENTYARARIAAQLGDKGGAVDLLRTAFAQGAYVSIDLNWLHLEPSLEGLRGYPPFEELIRPQ